MLICAIAALAAGLGGCGVLGSSCDGGRRSGGHDGPCTDGAHFLECSGGEGYEYDVERACPDEAPVCVDSKQTQGHNCRSHDQLQCLTELPEIGLKGLQGGDLNADGLTDLAFVSSEVLTVALAASPGGYSTPIPIAAGATQFRLAQLIQPGVLDMVALNENGDLIIVPGDGDGAFSAGDARKLFTGAAELLGVGDVDGDQRDDIIIEDAGGLTALLESRKDFAAALIAAQSIKLGRPVIAATAGDAMPQLFLDDGNGTIGAYSPDVGAWVRRQDIKGDLVGAADLDADGVDELLVNDSNRLGIAAGQPDGSFVKRQTFDDPGLLVGDFDGDGDGDIALSRSGLVVPLLNQGDGTFDSRPPLAVAFAPTFYMTPFVADTTAGTTLIFANGSSASQLSSACLTR